jgi:SnoaL-like domain
MNTIDTTDRLRIAEVLSRYCVVIDARDFNGLYDVFTADVTFDYGEGVGVRTGVDELIRWTGEFLSVFAATQHELHTCLVEPLGPHEAEARTYWTAHHTPPGSTAPVLAESVFTASGSYLDRLTKTADGWRISHRTTRMLVIGGDVKLMKLP